MPRISLVPLSFAPVALATMFATAAGGCGGGDDRQNVNTGQPPPQQCPPGYYFDGRGCVPQQSTPPPAPSESAPPPGPPPPAPPMDPNAAAAATQLLDGLAKQHTPPGAKKVGTPINGQFQTGQSAEQALQLQPGKCYTVVGAGVPTIQELDIQILPTVAVPGMPALVMAQDQTTGPTAVLGGQPNCFKWAAPVGTPVRVVLTVRAGQGPAAAQVYEK
jgi:hypothetical protein